MWTGIFTFIGIAFFIAVVILIRAMNKEASRSDYHQ